VLGNSLKIRGRFRADIVIWTRPLIMLKAFQDFYNQLKYCDWEIPSDIMKSFRTADLVNCEVEAFNRLVFNIGGNKYRMICGYQSLNVNLKLFAQAAANGYFPGLTRWIPRRAR
jgi:mRNA-degrading endonuclease HigB of HigAB toxin-antitoxin module